MSDGHYLPPSPPHIKLLGNLIMESYVNYIMMECLTTYIKKHGICTTKQEQIDTDSIQQYLKQLKIHKRATVIKLIHQWIPTQDFLHKQHCSQCQLCPRCNAQVENASHILNCSHPDAKTFRTSALYDMLNKLKQSHTSIHILQALEDNLSDHLSTENRRKYIAPFIETSRFQQVRNAVIHQNIIGWGNFMRGYISSKWRQCQTAQVSTNKRSHTAQWGCLLVKLTLELHLQIWNDRNQVIHGKTVAESRLKARAAVLQ